VRGRHPHPPTQLIQDIRIKYSNPKDQETLDTVRILMLREVDFAQALQSLVCRAVFCSGRATTVPFLPAEECAQVVELVELANEVQAEVMRWQLPPPLQEEEESDLLSDLD